MTHATSGGVTLEDFVASLNGKMSQEEVLYFLSQGIHPQIIERAARAGVKSLVMMQAATKEMNARAVYR